MKRVLIVGGGTAGWLAALYFNWKFVNVDVKVIESSEIGILGAGEGTTPHFMKFLEELGIDVGHFITHTKGTVKNGIKFTNWNGDDNFYYHPFGDNNGESIARKVITAQKLISEEVSLDVFQLTAHSSEDCKTKFFIPVEEHPHTNNSPYSKYKIHGSCALHFDARLVAQYFKDIAISRGVMCVDGIVYDTCANTNNEIERVLLKDGSTHECDILVDCTGLHRVFIGDHYNAEWVSYKKHIPNDSAQPFFLPITTDKIPPYTEAIAMKYGWVWKIPVQGRFGCGYVYNSKFASNEDIKQEIISKFGTDADILNRSFKFNAGVYRTPWVKNCVAVGLAAGFIEPLEATSIWVTITSLREITPQLIENLDEVHIASYNKSIYTMNQSILDFIYYHYITKRQDTLYWKDFEKDNEPTETIKNYKNTFQSGFVEREIVPSSEGNVFSVDSWLSVGAGLKFFNKKHCEKNFAAYSKFRNMTTFERQLKHEYDQILELKEKFLDHKTLLDKLEKEYNNEN